MQSLHRGFRLSHFALRCRQSRHLPRRKTVSNSVYIIHRTSIRDIIHCLAQFVFSTHFDCCISEHDRRIFDNNVMKLMENKIFSDVQHIIVISFFNNHIIMAHNDNESELSEVFIIFSISFIIFARFTICSYHLVKQTRNLSISRGVWGQGLGRSLWISRTDGPNGCGPVRVCGRTTNHFYSFKWTSSGLWTDGFHTSLHRSATLSLKILRADVTILSYPVASTTTSASSLVLSAGTKA